MIKKITTHKENLYCSICKRYLTDSGKDDLIETGAPISGSVPVCPHCKKATFGDGLEYRKENPKEWVSVESLNTLIEQCKDEVEHNGWTLFNIKKFKEELKYRGE